MRATIGVDVFVWSLAEVMRNLHSWMTSHFHLYSCIVFAIIPLFSIWICDIHVPEFREWRWSEEKTELPRRYRYRWFEYFGKCRKKIIKRKTIFPFSSTFFCVCCSTSARKNSNCFSFICERRTNLLTLCCVRRACVSHHNIDSTSIRTYCAYCYCCCYLCKQ